jgi:citrate/tricarballylate utilization protein
VHATESLAEADRLMTICNSCRYCEGLCPVFPAMELRRAFSDQDLNYLANLCHSCGACYVDCQFSPPHEFNVNVPLTLARVRAESYQAYAWPRCTSALFARNGLVISIVAAACVAAFIGGFVAWNGRATLFHAGSGPGSFYALMPHSAMAMLFGGAFLYAATALANSVAMFWKDTGGGGSSGGSLLRAMGDAGRLRYLDGGGAGCFNEDEQPESWRKLFHHLTFYGFLLCFASTSVATFYHFLMGREAPYPWWDLPVILGTAGGLGLLAGTAGLFAAKMTRERALRDNEHLGMDTAFIAMLFLTALSGLLLLFLRETPAMGLLLAAHLGAVFGFFITLPYGKFVHGLYRYAALVRFAEEREAGVAKVSDPR